MIDAVQPQCGNNGISVPGSYGNGQFHAIVATVCRSAKGTRLPPDDSRQCLAIEAFVARSTRWDDLYLENSG